MFGPLETNINASIAEADRLAKKREAERLAEIENKKSWKDKCINFFTVLKKIIFN
jgi:hypothetical protein